MTTQEREHQIALDYEFLSSILRGPFNGKSIWECFIESETYKKIPPDTYTTTIRSVQDDELSMELPVTDCCGIGPITSENYCPNCGKRILKP